MRHLLVILACVFAAGVLPGCDPKREASRDRADVVDRDFTALIAKTSDPYVFAVEIKKTNPKANKKIGGLACAVELSVTDAYGKAFNTTSEEITQVFGALRSTPVDCLKGNIRLMKSGLPAGTYTVRPRVRIQEVGKDKLTGPHPDGGTVAIPAANSVQVVVR